MFRTNLVSAIRTANTRGSAWDVTEMPVSVTGRWLSFPGHLGEQSIQISLSVTLFSASWVFSGCKKKQGASLGSIFFGGGDPFLTDRTSCLCKVP